jgi:hypothetical protein
MDRIHHRALRNYWGLIVVGLVLSGGSQACGQRWISGIAWSEPPIVQPGDNSGPPSDAIVLFDGDNLDAWEGGDQWELKDGYAIAQNRTIQTKQHFGDVQLHVEFASPSEVRGSGQGRANSGVFLMGRYEVQILDSWENETYFEGQAASIYNQAPPLVNASRPPGQWQTLQILFTAPRFDDDGELKSPAYITVLHNGVLVQYNWEVQGVTHFHRPPDYQAHGKGPITLQHHGDPVQFRNIWVREIALKPGVDPPAEPEPEAETAEPEPEAETAEPEPQDVADDEDTHT